MKVFIADDDESLTTIIATALEREGFTVAHVGTGKDALARIRTELPNLIILDQVLPDISGNQILKQLKQDIQTKDIPVFMLSNFSQGELVNEAINDGAAEYIYKYQVEISDIVNKIKETLNPPQPTKISE